MDSVIYFPMSDQWFEPAMIAGESLAPVFGGIVATGPGAGMALLILFAAIVGIMIPSFSYAIPAFRNVEDQVPDNVIISSHPLKSTQTLRDKPKSVIPRPSTDD